MDSHADVKERAAARLRISLFVPTPVLDPLASTGEKKRPLPVPPMSSPDPKVLPAVPRAGPRPERLGLQAPTEAVWVDQLQKSGRSMVEQCKTLAAANGYDGLVLELANQRWIERWERLCFNSEADGDYASSLPSSTSRMNLASAAAPPTSLPTMSEAEAWRKQPFFKRAELNVTKPEEARGLTVLLSQWLELDAEDEGVRFDAEIALRQEIAYAAYLGATEMVLPPPSSHPKRVPYLTDYARAVRACLVGHHDEAPLVGPHVRLAVRIPVSSPHLLSELLSSSSPSASNGMSEIPANAYLRANDNWAWETWERLQTLCGYSSQLSVALDLAMPLPPTSSIDRWASEPVSLVWLPASSFLANARGYPVLSKSAQSLLRQLAAQSPRLVLSDIATPPAQHTRGGPSAYLEYLRHLDRSLPPPSAMAAHAKGYENWLQAPLQPMAHNLSADTYRVFESDPVKYDLYEEAVYQALKQHRQAGEQVRIWVVGAGHGALVTRCLAAAERASRTVHITALEKNPGACIGLQERLLTEWGSERVSVLQGDMRKLAVPPPSELADIVVSELLGSFGDNELAPECLDGAMRFLRRDGIAIPSSYVSYIAPISTPKIHATLKNQALQDAPTTGLGMGAPVSASRNAFETPFVVYLQSMNLLSADQVEEGYAQVQPCWRFEHGPMQESGLICNDTGLPMTNSHNVRSSLCTFSIPHAGVCHGLAGYFEAHLFGDVSLSIFPDASRASANMVSWFPMFFPLREPLYLPALAQLDVRVWRLSDEVRVWYEWAAEVFLPLESKPPAPALLGRSPGRNPAPVSGVENSFDESQQSTASDTTMPFKNAPTTPMTPAVARMGDASSTPQAPKLFSPQHAPASSPATSGLRTIAPPSSSSIAVRVKTGQTEIMNAGGASSSLTIST